MRMYLLYNRLAKSEDREVFGEGEDERKDHALSRRASEYEILSFVEIPFSLLFPLIPRTTLLIYQCRGKYDQ